MFEIISQVKATDLGPITNIDPPQSNFKNLNEILSGAGTVVLEIAGGLALMAIVYSGIMYMISGGDTAKAEVAKKNLVWSIIGLIVIFLAFTIIKWVNNILTI